ncbi:hypothetical protein [Hymenobacter sp. B81]|uniref:hypothetical protein n=1 Tax=Hymenobacter sp. B81 TaxID=3344878 RepID=UPI0037DCB6B8
MPQIHLNPTPSTADAIRQKAARAGVSVNAFLAPFLNAIADGSLTMVVHFPPPSQQKS